MSTKNKTMIDPAAELGGMGGGMHRPDMPPITPSPAERLVHAAQLADQIPLSPDLEGAQEALFTLGSPDDLQFQEQVKGITDRLKVEVAGDDPEKQGFIDNFQKGVAAKEITKDDFLNGLTAYKNKAALTQHFTPEQMEQANEVIASLHNEDPTTETGFNNIKQKLGRFSGIFKTVGALFIGVVGLIIFKGIQAAKGDLAPAR